MTFLFKDNTKEMIKKYETDEMNYRKSIKECFKGSKEELVEEMQNFNAEVSLKKKHLEKVSFPSLFFFQYFFNLFISDTTCTNSVYSQKFVV